MLQVDNGQFDENPVVPLRPDHRLGVTAAVDPTLDDLDGDVTSFPNGSPRPDVGDLELEMRAALQVEAFVHVDLLRESQKADVQCRDAADLAGKRLVGGRPVDIREPVDENGKQGEDANQKKEATIDAHRRESI